MDTKLNSRQSKRGAPKLVTITARLTEGEKELLRVVGFGNASAGVRRLLKMHALAVTDYLDAKGH